MLDTLPQARKALCDTSFATLPRWPSRGVQRWLERGGLGAQRTAHTPSGQRRGRPNTHRSHLACLDITPAACGVVVSAEVLYGPPQASARRRRRRRPPKAFLPPAGGGDFGGFRVFLSVFYW